MIPVLFLYRLVDRMTSDHNGRSGVRVLRAPSNVNAHLMDVSRATKENAKAISASPRHSSWVHAYFIRCSERHTDNKQYSIAHAVGPACRELGTNLCAYYWKEARFQQRTLAIRAVTFPKRRAAFPTTASRLLRSATRADFVHPSSR